MLLLKPFTVDPGRSMVHREDPTYVHFHFASKVCHLTTRIRVRLLGPCFKTGWLKPLCQHLKNAGPALHYIKPLTSREHRSAHCKWKLRNRPAARRVLGASVHHRPFAQSQSVLPFRPPSLVPHSELMLASDTVYSGQSKLQPLDTATQDRLQSLLLSTISSPFSLSFQSSFHLSFTVLVRYRSLANI